MTRRLPSLTALRTFEVAARLKSFSKAAEELSVTPAAVGFQIKQLEEELGAPLFVRKHRTVELTSKGAAFARELGPAFESITSAWQSVDTQASDVTLAVTAPENAVLDWLIPATTAAQSTTPGPMISWDANRQLRDFDSGAWDVAIRYCLEPDDRYFCEPILRSWFTPLMRPEVARHIHDEKDILQHGLINVEYRLDGRGSTNAWPPFLSLMNLPANPDFAMTCPNTRTATELAAESNYIALSGFFAAEKYLKKRSLMSPIPKAIMPKSRFWFMCAKGRESSDEISWLRSVLHGSAERLLESAKGTEFFEMDGSPVKNRI